MRLYFAITLPDSLQDVLADETAMLRRAVPNVAWVAPGLLHLTLKFLGECDESMRPELERVGREVAASTAPHSVTLVGGGAFPNFLAPRVVWIGMQSATLLTSMATQLERSLEPLGFASERRPFRAHVTLGRVRTVLSRDECRRLEHGLRTVRGAWPLRVSYLSLMQSDLRNGAPRYVTRGDFPLGAA